MSDVTYIFNDNTLDLYNTYRNQPLNQLLQGPYKDIVGKFSENQKNQYNYWISLSPAQKEFIENEIYEGRGPVIANTRLFNATEISLPTLNNLMSQNQIVGYKILNREYVQFADINGNNYIVYARYVPETNQVLSH